MAEVFVVVRDPEGGGGDERFVVEAGRVPGRGWWLKRDDGGVAEVQEVRTIGGERVAYADRRAGIRGLRARSTPPIAWVSFRTGLRPGQSVLVGREHRVDSVTSTPASSVLSRQLPS